MGRRRIARICRKADEGVVFASSIEKEEEDIVGRWQRECFAGGEESMEVRVARIWARVAELTGNAPVTAPPTNTLEEENENRAMWNVLGYTITNTETGNQELNSDILEIHRRRMEDILGPGVMKVKQLCEERGIWCRELGSTEFRVLTMNFEDEGMHDWGVHPWTAVEENVRKRMAGVGDKGREDDEMQLEAMELGRQLRKNGVRFSLPDGLSAEEMLRRARKKMDLYDEGKLRSVEEKTVPDLAAAERFRARRAAKEALKSPKEMRDIAEESVERVKTREE
ncbi:hypothetical protein N431DRAFT_501953 [Stipitochalara longipes BDJ]|nr:hypothetical protein N431DRAFT_501953 [Stipitochalara longipes BDJ]